MVGNSGRKAAIPLQKGSLRWSERVARDDMMEFMIASARFMKTDYGDGLYGMKKDILKQVSHYGGIRVASHLVANIVSQQHVAQFTARRQIIETADGHKRAFYQLVYDGGNVAYAEYFDDFSVVNL